MSTIAIALIALAGILHLAQEWVQDFGPFQNVYVFKSERPDHPVPRWKARLVDGIGLGAAIVSAAAVSAHYESPYFLAVLLGHYAADDVQHAGHRWWFRHLRRVVPGWTSAAYLLTPALLAGLWVMRDVGGFELDGIGYAFAGGASLVTVNFVGQHYLAWRERRRAAL